MSFAPASEPVQLRLSRYRQPLFFQMRLELDYLNESVGNRERTSDLQMRSYVCRVLDGNRAEILAHHWHPIGSSRVVTPHIHVPSARMSVQLGTTDDQLLLSDLHIAAGFISFRGIVRMLIEEFSVQPLRDDWRDILASPETPALPE